MSATEQNNKQTIARVIREVLNEGRFALVDELFADVLVEHDPHQVVADDPRQAFVAAVTQFREAFPDQETVIDAQIAENDLVATRWHMNGTHSGPFMGVPASGRCISVSGIFFDRLEDGRIVETWANYDLHGLLQQIR